ncbi:MAG: hypothetical protein K0R31_330 [Clostridiales bacterium]|nr:hypothetical protein [Clostridiales bacterium]
MVENRKADKLVNIDFCNLCGKALKNEWKFCPYCRTPIETCECIFCGQKIRVNWNYCPLCKHEVKVERKNRHRFDKCNEWLRDILKNK